MNPSKYFRPLALVVLLGLAFWGQFQGGSKAADLHGDPLPEGAVARFGTVRLRAGCDVIAFAPDAKTLIGLERWSLRVWDAAKGQLLEDRTLPGGPKEPEGDLLTALSPDGRTLIFAEGGAVELWDLPSAKRLDLSLPKDRKPIDAIALSDDRRLLAFVETVGTREAQPKGGFGLAEPIQQLWLWDTNAVRAVQLCKDDSSLVALAVSPNGRFVAASSSLEGTRVWDAASHKQIWKTPSKKHALGHELEYNAGKLAFTPDGRRLIASPGGGQHDWFVWEADTGRPVEKFQPPTIGYAWDFAISPDGQALLIPTSTDYVLWDLQEGRIRHEWPGALQAGKGVFAPDGRSVVTHDTILRRWDVKTGKLLYVDVSLLGHTAPVRHCFFSPNGQMLTSIGDDGVAWIWDVPTGKPRRTIDLKGVQTQVWTTTPDGNTLIAAEEKLTVHRWPLDKEGRRESVELREAQELDIRLEPQHIRVTADGKTLVVSAWPRLPEYQYRKYSFSFWDLATGKFRHWGGDPGNDFGGDDSWLSPDGTVTAGRGGVFDVRTGERRYHLPVEGQVDAGGIHVFSPDGRLVAALAKDARVWEVATGKPLTDLSNEGTYRAAFSRDGRYYASADWTKLQVWDLASGKVVLDRPAPQHLDGGSDHWASAGVLFAPDGRTVATGHPDGTVLLWALPPKVALAVGLTEREADDLWADLVAEPSKAYTAVWRLREFPTEAVRLLTQRYPPLAAMAACEVGDLILKLDSERFEVREAASRRLKKLGRAAEGALRQSLKEDLLAEQKGRVEALLALLAPAARPQGEDLRAVRAVAVLEGCGTPQARHLLEQWAKGSANAWLTDEATRAVSRLQLQPPRRD